MIFTFTFCFLSTTCPLLLNLACGSWLRSLEEPVTITYVRAYRKKRRRNCGFAIQLFPDCRLLFPTFSYPIYALSTVFSAPFESRTSPPLSEGTITFLPLVLSTRAMSSSLLRRHYPICRGCHEGFLGDDRLRHHRGGTCRNEIMLVHYQIAQWFLDPLFSLEEASRSSLLRIRWPISFVLYIPTGTVLL